MNKLALHIKLDILSGAIEKKPAPGNHEPNFEKKVFALIGNRLYKGGDPSMTSCLSRKNSPWDWKYNFFTLKGCGNAPFKTILLLVIFMPFNATKNLGLAICQYRTCLMYN